MSHDPTAERPRLAMMPDAPAGDRAARARQIADDFARRFPPTLPPPGSDSVPSGGRHVRCTAETPGQIYLGGEYYPRDARARITVRSSGMPVGWCVRITLVESTLVALNATAPVSRADPAVLRAQRQMGDPAASAQLSAPLRAQLPGRPVHAELHSLFVPGGMAFIREASVVVPISPDPADDRELAERLHRAAAAALARGEVSLEPADEPGPAPLRRGHLRVIQ